MKLWNCLIALCLLSALTACQGGGNVGQKVLADFGIGEHPEGYVSGSDKVFEQLDTVGKTEMKRMNAAGRNGEIKFVQDGLHGSYHKLVKQYESFYPLDVKAATASQDRGYTGLIEYTYRMYKSEDKPSKVEAAAMSANVPTDEQGKETYRYSFSVGGTWDGAKGERSSR